MSREITKTDVAVAVAESLALRGDISGLSPENRIRYYLKTCKDLGLNPSASRALWAIAVGDLDAAIDAHCDATGLDRDAWIAATLDEQRATLAGGVTA